VNKFLKKPVEVEAMCFMGWATAYEIFLWAPVFFVPEGYDNVLRTPNELDSNSAVIDTAPSYMAVSTVDGVARVNIGQWIVKDPEKDEYEVLSSEEFQETYQTI